MNSNDNLIGIGLYSLAEAARLAGVNYQTISRWSASGKEKEAILKRDIPKIGEHHYLSFLDLIEIKFVKAFRDCGVSWSNIKDAACKAAKDMKTTHPFSSVTFKTDGKRIFMVMGQQDKAIDLNKLQYVFERVIAPTFKKELRFENKSSQPTQWFPEIGKGKIALDPNRSFGKPILIDSGIPTATIYSSYLAEDNSAEIVSRWFDISKASVEAAVAFEIQLAA